MSQGKGVCRYGTDCYRVNPVHLKEFSHPHLEKIIKNSTNGRYEIPDDIFVTSDILRKQIEIIKPFLPTQSSSPKITTGAEVSGVLSPSESSSSPTSITVTVSPKSETKLNVLAPVFQPQPKKIKLDTIQTPLKVEPSTSRSVDNTSSSFLEAKQSKSHKMEDYLPVVPSRGQMLTKLRNAHPYNIFLTTITSSKPTHSESLSVTFQELLDESLGELESSLQINFMVELGWLLAQYYFAGQHQKPLLILYGDETPDLRTISSKRPNIQTVKIEMNGAFGIHHTKMMIFVYKDNSVRVVVSTANLYEDDWHNRTQGLWISPLCPELPEDADTFSGDSVTGFKTSLLNYLTVYKQVKLQPYISRIRRCDFSAVNVFLISSIPGTHRTTPNGPQWGHARFGHILTKHSAPIDDGWPIVCQSSSIGSLGQNSSSWIHDEFLNSLKRDSRVGGLRRIPEFKMIYPSFENVVQSHDGILGGGCLPYSKNINDKQPWLKNFLYQWKAKKRHRNQAMPHIKSYCRWNKDQLAWFCLTSANLSKAAWGMFNKGGLVEKPLRILNYECGVLFLPKLVIDEDYFSLENFPMPYDVPLTKYGIDDVPFLSDLLH